MRLFSSKRWSRLRRGSSVVEFAMIAPLMILFAFGVVEIGRLVLVKQTAIHATREGARVAVRPTADHAEVTQRVQDELAVLLLTDVTIETEPASLEFAEPGAEITVRVRIGIDSISWIPDYFNFAVNDMVAETCMRRESTD
ncbi:MAG: pilus assembly protein [Rubripirellula sp.]|jgi:hypothetical protein|nr:pilus assembly protein [Rubripirellula sp.]